MILQKTFSKLASGKELGRHTTAAAGARAPACNLLNSKFNQCRTNFSYATVDSHCERESENSRKDRAKEAGNVTPDFVSEIVEERG